MQVYSGHRLRTLLERVEWRESHTKQHYGKACVVNWVNACPVSVVGVLAVSLLGRTCDVHRRTIHSETLDGVARLSAPCSPVDV